MERLVNHPIQFVIAAPPALGDGTNPALRSLVRLCILNCRDHQSESDRLSALASADRLAAGAKCPSGIGTQLFIPEPTGCYFVLTDTVGEDVLCVVEPEALVTAAKECGIDDQEMQSVFRELRSAIEACASDLYDAAGLGPDGAVHVRAADLLAS
jgi:hypothetical protein